MVREGGLLTTEGYDVGQWLCIILVGLLSLLTTEGYDVGLTFLDSAVAKGAGKLPFFLLYQIFVT